MIGYNWVGFWRSWILSFASRVQVCPSEDFVFEINWPLQSEACDWIWNNTISEMMIEFRIINMILLVSNSEIISICFWQWMLTNWMKNLIQSHIYRFLGYDTCQQTQQLPLIQTVWWMLLMFVDLQNNSWKVLEAMSNHAVLLVCDILKDRSKSAAWIELTVF